MSDKTYRIKPLAWEHCLNKVVEQFSAPAIGGVYEVRRLSHSRKWWWMFDDGDECCPESHDCRTAAEGKAAAEDHWRRTMESHLEEKDAAARPRLAPEHVETLRFLLCYYDEYEKRHGLVVGSDSRAIRAALAALGEGTGHE